VHQILDAYRRGGGLAGGVKAIAAVSSDAEKTFIGRPAQEVDYLGSTLEALPEILAAYDLRWSTDTIYEPFASEHSFKCKIEPGMVFEGKVDGMVRDTRDGAVLVWETKTPSRTGPWYYDKLVLDSQCRGYIIAQRSLTGLPVNSTVYDILRKPQIKAGVNESPEAFAKRLGATYLAHRDELLERRVVTPPEHLLQQYYGDLASFGRELLWRTEHAEWPQYHPGNRIGRCAFFGLCVDREERFYRQREADEIFPELEEEEETQ